MKTRVRVRGLAAWVLAAAVMVVSGSAVWAQEAVRASWDALPRETVFAMRTPELRGLLQVLRERTVLGRDVLSAQRVEQFRQLLEEEAADDMQEMRDDLARFGLQPADLLTGLTGGAGLGVVIESQPDRDPLFVMLGWLEPGEELAGRLDQALTQALQEQPEGPAAVQRVDLEVAGRQVIHLTIPEMAQDIPADLWEMPENFGEMTEEQQQSWWEERQKLMEDAPVREVDRTHVLLTRLGGRLVAAVVPPQSRAQVSAARAAGGEPDLEALTGLEAATGVFARFLESHVGGEPGGFAGQILATAGLGEAMPAGQPIMEALGTLKPVWDALAASAQREPDEFVRMQKQQMVGTMQALGLTQLGAVAFKASLDGNVVRSGLFAEAAAPRQGVLQLFDQPAVAPRPADWVPANVISYTHFSLNLGQTYRTVRQLLVAQFGPMAEETFAQGEQQVAMVTGQQVLDILDSLGTPWAVLTFEPDLDAAEAAGQDMDADMAMEDPMGGQRMAFAVPTTNEQIWRALLQQAKLQVPPGDQSMTFVDDEQGFAGVRSGAAVPVEYGLFVGSNHLVAGLGKDVAAEVLSALRNPPQGDRALRGHPMLARAAGLLELRPSLAFQFTDASRSAPTLRLAAEQMIDETVGVTDLRRAIDMEWAGPDAEAELVQLEQQAERFKAVLPTQEELKAAFGIGVSQTFMTSQGMVSQSALELPAAE